MCTYLQSQNFDSRIIYCLDDTTIIDIDAHTFNSDVSDTSFEEVSDLHLVVLSFNSYA